MHLSLNLLIFLTIISFASCTKGSDTASSSSCSLSASFIIGKWQLEKVEIKNNGVYTDMTGSMEPCQKDDYSLIKTDGTTVDVDAGVVCTFYINHPVSYWTFVNGKFYVNGIERVVTVLNCNKIIIEYVDPGSGQVIRETANRLP